MIDSDLITGRPRDDKSTIAEQTLHELHKVHHHILENADRMERVLRMQLWALLVLGLLLIGVSFR